jgi:hypothetical protein
LVPNQKIMDYKQYLDDMRAREYLAKQEGKQFLLSDE